MEHTADLYQQVILEHHRSPRNFRKLDTCTHHCDGRNPLCGDHISVFLDLTGDRIIKDISFQGSGCAISVSSASLMTQALKGKRVEEARQLTLEFQELVKGNLDPEKAGHHLGKLVLFRGVRQYPARVKCASLAWHALTGALDQKQGASTEGWREGASRVREDIEVMDLSGVKCPLNFVKVKVRLSRLAAGDQLAVILDDGEPVENVPKSLELDGQVVLLLEPLAGGQHRMVVEKSA